MDANGTRFHLLLGERDWAASILSDGSGVLAAPNSPLQWDARRGELHLRAELSRFQAAPNDRAPEQDDRRGAAIDASGNWYWIAADREEIRVHSCGDLVPMHFWSSRDASVAPAPADSIFQPPAPPPAPGAQRFCGLAVTDDQYLVAGTDAPAGLLIFDLLGGGPPRALVWPVEVSFAPFDLAPRPAGGLWVLDRVHRRLWTLDRTLRVVTTNPGAAPAAALFEPADGGVPSRQVPAAAGPLKLADAMAISAREPVAIEALPDGSALILDAPSRVVRQRFAALLGEAKLDFAAYDFAFASGRLHVVAAEGNQAMAFDVELDGGLALKPVGAYFPMRRFGGKALVAAGDKVFYDFAERWLPLVAQPRPRHVVAATLETRAFDAREPGCVWHRLLVEAGLPPGTTVEVESRAADAAADLARMPWNREPRLIARARSELPFAPVAPGRGIFELLLQQARGRFCQLRLRLQGDGRLTPRLHALRLYYPRFSYLARYLPAVYREDAESASFLDRFLANLEGINTALEDRIAAVQMLFDPRTAPPEALAWLASWLGVALDPAWNEARRRLFLAHAMEFFQWRGTVRGMRMALRLALDEHADARLFDPPDRECRCVDRFRIVERFRTRVAQDEASRKQAAHRFTVLLPVKRRATTAEDEGRRRLAGRVVELEKPAHTTFDVKFFWALFRIGEARLGTDSVPGLGGRDPALLPTPAVLGRSHLAECQITPASPSAGRVVLDRARLSRPPHTLP